MIFKFLDEASKSEFLNIVRREVKPRVPVSKNDAIVDGVIEEMMMTTSSRITRYGR